MNQIKNANENIENEGYLNEEQQNSLNNDIEINNNNIDYDQPKLTNDELNQEEEYLYQFQK